VEGPPEKGEQAMKREVRPGGRIKPVRFRDTKVKEQCRNPDCRRVFEVLSWKKGYTRCPFCDWPAAESGLTLTEEADQRAQIAEERFHDKTSERVYVLAGNVRQYEAYIATKRGGAYRRISGYTTLLAAARGLKYVRVGDWHLHPELGAIECELETLKAEEVQP
jgi:hypothetical protein